MYRAVTSRAMTMGVGCRTRRGGGGGGGGGGGKVLLEGSSLHTYTSWVKVSTQRVHRPLPPPVFDYLLYVNTRGRPGRSCHVW